MTLPEALAILCQVHTRPHPELGFIIERDGAEFALVPEKPVGVVGRQIFQKNGYSDTPTPPLMEMRFVDSKAMPGEKHTYRVITVNSVGLKSSAAATSN